jgi:hypothetical protein
MSNQGVRTRGKAKFGSIFAAAVIDAVVTNSVKSAVEDTIGDSNAAHGLVEGVISQSQSVAPDVKKNKAKAG